MEKIKIVSFDVEGTLVTTDFSYSIWFEAIPEKYAERHGITFEQAKKFVMAEYEKVGDQASEWYDIHYWFNKFDIGDPEPVMEKYQNSVSCFPEVDDVLSSLQGKYVIIAASGSHRQFLNHLLRDIQPYFSHVFSSVSDFQQVKTPEFYRGLCKSLNVQPWQIINIGDNWQFDCASPLEAGINAIYLDRKGENIHPNSITSLGEIKARLLR
jgi:HAD superfamily hydrolase (TIGR01549 family)